MISYLLSFIQKTKKNRKQTFLLLHTLNRKHKLQDKMEFDVKLLWEKRTIFLLLLLSLFFIQKHQISAWRIFKTLLNAATSNETNIQSHKFGYIIKLINISKMYLFIILLLYIFAHSCNFLKYKLNFFSQFLSKMFKDVHFLFKSTSTWDRLGRKYSKFLKTPVYCVLKNLNCLFK